MARLRSNGWAWLLAVCAATLLLPLAGGPPPASAEADAPLRYLDEDDPRRWLTDRFFERLPSIADFDDLQRWVFAGGWLVSLRAELQALPHDEPPADGNTYRFLTFVTPGPDPADRPRAEPFDLVQALQRTYRDGRMRFVGATDGNRLVYEWLAVGQTTPRRLSVAVASARGNRWIIRAIDDPGLRFCLLERRMPGDAGRSGRWAYRLASQAEARAAVRDGIAPHTAVALELPFMRERMHLQDPRMRPVLQVRAIDRASGTARFPHLSEDTRCGARLRDLLGNRYRLVALHDDYVELTNWAEVRFIRRLGDDRLEMRGDYVLFTADGVQPLATTETSEAGDDAPPPAVDDEPRDRRPDATRRLPNHPVRLTYLGIDEQDRAVFRRTDDQAAQETVRAGRGATITDGGGRTYRVVQMGPERVLLADSRGQGYALRIE